MTAKRIKRRRSDPQNGGMLMILAKRYAQPVITLAVAAGIVMGAVSHFATAADVESKFQAIQLSIRQASLDSQIAMEKAEQRHLEDKLDELRNAPATRSNRAAILRYETRLDNVNDRIRSLEERRSK